ncbi:MAG: hypothetical protein ACF8XB_04090, partial [Planctomycetota bacterium JB042]
MIGTFVGGVALLLCVIGSATTTAQDVDGPRLVERWADVASSRDRVASLRADLEASATQGLVETSTHDVFKLALAGAEASLVERQERLELELDRLAQAYRDDPDGVAAQLLTIAQSLDDAERPTAAMWLRGTLMILEENAALAPLPERLPEELLTNYQAVVRRFLIDYFDADVSIDDVPGGWDDATEAGVRVAIREVTSQAEWGLDDAGIDRPDGVLTPELYIHLMGLHDAWLEALDPEGLAFVIDVGDFLRSLWHLRAARVYLPEPHAVTAERLLGTLTGGRVDGRWSPEDVAPLVALLAAVRADPSYAADWPEEGGGTYSLGVPFTALQGLAWSVVAEVEGEEGRDREALVQALHFAYLVDSMVECEAAVREVAAVEFERQALRTVQEIALDAGFWIPRLTVGAEWGAPTGLAVSAFVEELQLRADVGWTGDVDGLYSQAFRAHFDAWLADRDP